MSPVKSPQEASARDIRKKNKIVAAKAEEEDLPPGWTIKVRIRKRGNGRTKKDRFYTDPVTGYIFLSLVDVQRYLKTGDLGRLAKKPKTTDKQIIKVGESKEQIPILSNPSIETPKSKSESSELLSKISAGTTIEAPPSPPESKTRKATQLAAPPLSPPAPKTRHTRRQAGIAIDPPPTTPPEPKTSKATQLTGTTIEPPPPPPPPSSPPEPKTSHQDNDGNADVAVVAKADKNQDLSPVSQPPLPAIIPPAESAIPAADSCHEKQELPVNNNPSQESSINYDFWTDPCIEFAVKTLTGAIPVGDLNKADNFPQSPPLEVPIEELWTDPCIEFAVKTLTGAIPIGEDPGIQDYLNHQNTTASSSGIKGGVQKSGNIGFHQQVSGSNGQSRQRFFH